MISLLFNFKKGSFHCILTIMINNSIIVSEICQLSLNQDGYYNPKQTFNMQLRQHRLLDSNQPFPAQINIERCSSCKVFHFGNHNCQIACFYCHDYHSGEDFIENMCPVMYPFAKKEQEKHSFTCKCCRGEGSYTQETQMVRYESKKKYQERLKEWQETSKPQEGLLVQKPKRRILQKLNKISEVQCKQCSGGGKISRMIKCCDEGCPKCIWNKYMINPLWKEYRKQPIKNQKLFICPICLMEVNVEDEKYTLDCKHEFHPDCIFKWMESKKSCPVCRRIDIYMQGAQFGANLQHERGQLNRSYNTEVNSDESEDDSALSY